MLLVIDNYDSFTWNLVHYLGELGAEPHVVRNDKITVEATLALEPEAIVLSPGPCTPNEAGICLELIARARGVVPIFGVCLGHQAIGQAYGGEVVRAPTLMHGKVSQIHHEGDGVFHGINGPFAATRYHSLTIAPETMPDELVATAHTQDGVIMGVRHRRDPVHGVQFHPESIASEHGHRILRNFLEIARAFNARAGRSGNGQPPRSPHPEEARQGRLEGRGRAQGIPEDPSRRRAACPRAGQEPDPWAAPQDEGKAVGTGS